MVHFSLVNTNKKQVLSVFWQTMYFPSSIAIPLCQTVMSYLLSSSILRFLYNLHYQLMRLPPILLRIQNQSEKNSICSHTHSASCTFAYARCPPPPVIADKLSMIQSQHIHFWDQCIITFFPSSLDLYHQHRNRI